MARNLRQPPAGYDVVKLPSAGRWAIVQLERDPRGYLVEMRPLRLADKTIWTSASRARAVAEITLYALESEVSRLRAQVQATPLAQTG